MIASGGVLSEGYGHGGPGVCLGDGQTEAEGVPSQGGRGDALLRRMLPHLTCPDLAFRPGRDAGGTAARSFSHLLCWPYTRTNLFAQKADTPGFRQMNSSRKNLTKGRVHTGTFHLTK